MTKQLISATALAFLLTAGVAAAQSTYPGSNPNNAPGGAYGAPTGQTGAPTSAPNTGAMNGGSGATNTPPGAGARPTTPPGTPNTGAGGDTAANILILSTSALIALGGAAYLARRPQA